MGKLGHGWDSIPGGEQNENEGTEAGMSCVCSHNRRPVWVVQSGQGEE